MGALLPSTGDPAPLCLQHSGPGDRPPPCPRAAAPSQFPWGLDQGPGGPGDLSPPSFSPREERLPFLGLELAVRTKSK